MATGDLNKEPNWPNLLAKYKLLRSIGEGGQGTVFLAKCHSGGLYACKSVQAGKSAENEVHLMQMTRGCYGTAQLHEVIRDTSHCHLIIQLYHCTLKERLSRIGAMGEEEAAVFFIQLATAVGEVHKKGIVHRDLKRSNIFLTAQGPPYEVKVGDFGYSTVCPPGATISVGLEVGTKKYKSPEALKGVYSSASDVWGLGIILYECLSGKLAFNKVDPQKLQEWLKQGVNVVADLDWSGLSRDAMAFISAMLKIDPKQRLSISAIGEHPWIVKNITSMSRKRKAQIEPPERPSKRVKRISVPLPQQLLSLHKYLEHRGISFDTYLKERSQKNGNMQKTCKVIST